MSCCTCLNPLHNLYFGLTRLHNFYFDQTPMITRMIACCAEQIQFEFTVNNRGEPQEGVIPRIKLLNLGGDEPSSFGPILSAQQNPTFVEGTIEESSGILRALNTISIVAQATSDLRVGATVTVRGLNGATAVDYVPPSEAPVDVGFVTSHQIGQGVWYPKTNEAIFTLIKSVPPLTDLEFEFDMVNPSLRQTPSDISISATVNGLPVTSVVLEGRVLGATIAPSFDLTEISESSRIAGAANTITISLRANTELMSGEEITISGLEGSLTPSTRLLPLYSSNGYLEEAGVWDASGGTLVATVASRDIKRAVPFSLRFTLINPFPGQTPVVPEVKTSLIPTTAVLSKDLVWHEGFARWRGVQPPGESNGQVMFALEYSCVFV
jgi:hypothetical protein